MENIRLNLLAADSSLGGRWAAPTTAEGACHAKTLPLATGSNLGRLRGRRHRRCRRQQQPHSREKFEQARVSVSTEGRRLRTALRSRRLTPRAGNRSMPRWSAGHHVPRPPASMLRPAPATFSVRRRNAPCPRQSVQRRHDMTPAAQPARQPTRNCRRWSRRL